ncbi:unnamed protein product [Rotaria magnacalcarata]|uniref:Major facilitator superfamily (MFS) profile domain-containing protein n=1 Tax=Rotaria magnacalcarata TaxID=392030 RepID=A0A819A421_9BILA|nr:unnamed protein product [Rotaria magnacalcarata]CAF3774161.1 unnamed protein product [Rotaria magnacalcarata]
MKFDTFLETVGNWGRFQKVKYIIICLTYMLPSIMVYSYTFTAAIPKYRCRNPQLESIDNYNETLNKIFDLEYKPTPTQCTNLGKKLSLEVCQSCYLKPMLAANENNSQTNVKLERCDKYVFEKTDYTKTLTEEWNIVCDRILYRTAAQMTFFFGYMVGSIFFGILADKYGRRPIMSVSFILMSFSGFLCAFGPQDIFGFWPSYIIFVLARFLLACSTRGISVSGFVLGSEIVGPRKRLYTGIVIEYFFAFGQFILVTFAYFIRTWRTLIWSLSIFTVPYIFFYFILPESPRWLVSKGRFDDAETVLRQIATKNKRDFNEDAFKQMKDEQENTMSSPEYQEGISSLLTSKIMLIISINLFFQWFVQNLVFYGVSQSTGLWDLDPYLAFTIGAFVELLAYIFVHLILDHVGRKKPYFIFAILFAIIAFLIIPTQKFTTKSSKIQRIMLTSIYITLKFLASASYAIIYIYANELFPTNIRNTGMGLCSMVARIGAMLSSFCNDYLGQIWIHLPVIIFGILSLVAGVLSLMFPETLNKPLPQSVADVEEMGFAGFRRRVPQVKITDVQTTSELYEENIIKRDLQKSDTNESKL